MHSRLVRNMDRIGIVAGALLCFAHSASSKETATPSIHIEDVSRFFAIYDAAAGQPSAEQLQRDYLDRGSEGLGHFAKMRRITGARIADTLAKEPQIYSSAKRCMEVLPRVRERVTVALRTLIQLYPQAKLPPVTIAVGRGKPVGVGSPVTGIQIGLEALCATEYMHPNVEDRFVYVIAHEYAHVQQYQPLVDKEHPTVLEGSLMEGAAELTAELMAGSVSNIAQAAMAKGREREIETAFLADVDKTDVSAWLYNGTREKSGDLGYWVGYRIAKTYYQRAADKQQALREILDMTDPKALLAKSGWYPGIPAAP
jgi:hypothetical protein